MEKIRLGISRCLLGERVRYDGGHVLDRFLTETLGQYVEYVPVCPEVEVGLPVPREPMHLEGDPDSPRLVTVRSKRDMTERMVGWARRRASELENEGLLGFIFKSDSPSSGMERVKVYGPGGTKVRKGVGIFARAFIEHFPLLPVEEDGRLHDTRLRENFIERIFAMQRWRDLLNEKRSRGNIVKFHTRHKLLVLSHSPTHYRTMGRLVAQVEGLSLHDLYSQYQKLLTEALKLLTTAKKNSNVLQHMMGYFGGVLSSDEKRELQELIDLYRNGHVPLIVPVTLFRHYVRKYNEPYLREQVYISPHPVELHLRNHV
jgi:uncharacterized protein YbgA (DUF1722 family)/uncharacterized protein YbbK (DUF523 family)